jgi:hypothetical protein
VPYSVTLCCFSEEIFLIHATSDDSRSMLSPYLSHQQSNYFQMMLQE